MANKSKTVRNVPKKDEEPKELQKKLGPKEKCKKSHALYARLGTKKCYVCGKDTTTLTQN